MSTFKIVNCIFCKLSVRRKVRHTNDAAKFCSRDCSYAYASQQSKLKKLIGVEVKALRSIANTIRRQKKCRHCNQIIYLKAVQLCKPCRDQAHIERRIKYRKTDSHLKSRRKHKSIRRSRIRGGSSFESFDPFDVFERDKWHCKICDIRTPRNKRGSLEEDAPELDHVIPLSKGGVHTRDNTQCLCRKCNQIKSDKV